MAASEDLISFDVIEGQKENIQALPSGRSAKRLAQLYSPSPLHKLSTPTPTDTKNVHDCIRAEYEAEISNISESDDPLDVYDRYVRWTLEAYPSAQATPQSQLHTLLERATKAFISAAQYKNDPRYLKLWLHYIHFFCDTPRETFVFLSRHGIGEGLALFYEEYAEWLEGVSRWAQAEEVYKMGIEREARPVQRLLRKFKEFEQRVAEQPDEAREPTSPALPTVRPALAAKVNPFGAAAHTEDPQAPRRSNGLSGAPSASKPGRSKLAVFSDADAKPSALSSRGEGSRGWDTIGSIKDRKKENEMEPKPWAGETLKAGGKKTAPTKMSVFRDPSLSQINNIVVVPSKSQVTVHPTTGKKEYIFVDLASIYPTPEQPGTELTFEELMAANRGWLDYSWETETIEECFVPEPERDLDDLENLGHEMASKLVVHQDRPMYDENGHVLQETSKLVVHQDRPMYDENGHMLHETSKPRGKKKKVMEVNETQIIKAKLDSPSGPKLRKKNTSEPTMTLHTRAATDDIYDIFNAPLKHPQANESGDEDFYETDGDYTTDGESTGTTRNVDVGEQVVGDDDEESDVKSVSEWSDFSTRRHVPNFDADDAGDDPDQTQSSGLLGDELRPDRSEQAEYEDDQESPAPANEEAEDLITPVDEHYMEPLARTSFVPVRPEDCEPPTRPYRDPAEVANSRLPFMTPITERTESSLDVDGERTWQFKTPSKQDASLPVHEEGEELDLEQLSSPIRELVNEDRPAPGLPTPQALRGAAHAGKALSTKVPRKGPIIEETQCNPVDEAVRNEILTKMHPPLASYPGFYDHRPERCERGSEIRKFARAMAKASKSGADRTSSAPVPVGIEFSGSKAKYIVRKELGAGAFAPVYLVENPIPMDVEVGQEDDENAPLVAMGKGAFAVRQRGELEALKMETPPTAWEFHMMRVAHTRLGAHHRAAASLSYAHEMHLYQNEAFLFLQYHPHGTLLDVINLFRAESSGVMDEQLAMFFTVELLRTVEAMHAKGVMHGDLKPDNCLLRLDGVAASGAASPGASPVPEKEPPLSPQWRADGSGGWSSRGIVLIDFGRAIDMRDFVPEVEFVADWKTTAQDCAEMREGRPWTWQIDYHGLAGTIHCLLFGKYIETVRADQGGIGRAGRKYRIRESLKRYWQTDIWGECFELLLNPASGSGGESVMPVLGPMRRVRERMEAWLEANCDKGVGLKAQMSRLEAHAKGGRK